MAEGGGAMKGHVSTGAIGYIEVDRPRPGPAAKGRGAVAVRPGPVAYYPGETEKDARAFAATVLKSYDGLRAREAARPAPAFSLARCTHDDDGSGYYYGDGQPVHVGCSVARNGRGSLFGDRSGIYALAERFNASRGVAPVVKRSIERKPTKLARTTAKYAAQVVKPSAPVMAPRVEAHDGGTLLCARCGRSDFRTPKGRDWHIANNPDCAKYRKPERHAYATL